MKYTLYLVLFIPIIIYSCHYNHNDESNKANKIILNNDDYGLLINRYKIESKCQHDTLFSKYTIGMEKKEVYDLNSGLIKEHKLKSYDGIFFIYPIHIKEVNIDEADLSFDFFHKKLFSVTLTFMTNEMNDREKNFVAIYNLYFKKYKYDNYAYYEDNSIKKHSWIKDNIQIDVYTLYCDQCHDGVHVRYFDWEQEKCKLYELEKKDSINNEINIGQI